MHLKSQKTIVLIVSVLLLVFIMPTYSFASNYDCTYTFYVQYGYPEFGHILYISVPPSVYDYYSSKSHRIYRESDYSKFVTPDAVKSIAENIQYLTRNMLYSDEQFANAVLILVNQISYVKSNAKYPVEAIVDNSGDCDVLSYLAASIMKAGGLDVVLLHYKERSPSHINIGVYLPYTPAYYMWWMAPKCYEYNGKKYGVAECTSQADWKVGDQTSKFAGANASIISLENCEKSSPARVSSSLDSPLIPYSISINLSPELSNVEERARTLKISGSISPAYPWQRVVMYVTQDGSSSNTFRTVFADHRGNYSFNWNFTSTGTYHIRTGWSGVSNYAGSDSEKLTVFIRLSQPLNDFEVPEYYWGAGPEYTSSHVSAAAYNLFINQDVKEFLKINLSGGGVCLSGELIILRNEQTVSISRSEQTTNDRFGFILRHNGGNNYSLSVKGLDDYDIFQITKRLDGNDTAFMNASLGTRKNTWYKVVAGMSEEEITAELYDKNGTRLQSVATRDDAMSISELAILMAYDTGTVIAFRNLKAETLNQPTQPVGGNHNRVYMRASLLRN
jgi:hypothetical protein